MSRKSPVLFCLLWDSLLLKQSPTAKHVRVSSPSLGTRAAGRGQQQHLWPIAVMSLPPFPFSLIIVVIAVLPTLSLSFPRIIFTKLLIKRDSSNCTSLLPCPCLSEHTPNCLCLSSEPLSQTLPSSQHLPGVMYLGIHVAPNPQNKSICFGFFPLLSADTVPCSLMFSGSGGQLQEGYG